MEAEQPGLGNGILIRGAGIASCSLTHGIMVPVAVNAVLVIVAHVVFSQCLCYMVSGVHQCQRGSGCASVSQASLVKEALSCVHHGQTRLCNNALLLR